MQARRWLGSALLALLLAGPVLAQAEADSAAATPIARTPEEVSQISLGLFKGLMSPYCPGASLRDCGSGQAEVLRDRIRAWVREGRSETWIEDELMAEFGPNILAAPRFEGMGAVTYVLPFVALVVGLIALGIFLSRQRGASPLRAKDAIVVDESQAGAPDPATRERLERELRSHLGG